MKTRCIFSFCLNSKETHSRWKMISLSPSSESGPGLSWTNEVFQVSAIKFLGTANNLRQKGKKRKKQPHGIFGKSFQCQVLWLENLERFPHRKTLFSTLVRKTGGDRCDEQSTSGYKSCSIKEAPLSLHQSASFHGIPPVRLDSWGDSPPTRVFLHHGPDLLLVQLPQRNKWAEHPAVLFQSPYLGAFDTYTSNYTCENLIQSEEGLVAKSCLTLATPWTV